MNLQTLVLDFHSQVFGNRFAVPFHERGVDIFDAVAIRTNDLGFEGFGLTVQGVELVVLTNVDFTDDSTFNEERQAPVEGGSGDGFVQILGIPEQLFCSEMTGLTEEGFDDSFALVGHAQSFAGEEFGKALPCFLIRVSHGLIEWLNLSPNLLRVKLIETKLRYDVGTLPSWHQKK